MIEKRDSLNRLYKHTGVALVYLVLTLAMTYPLGLRLGSHFLLSGNDFWIYPWNNWWIVKALGQGYNLLRTPYLFHPLGVSLIWHGFSWFSTLVWIPLQTVVGPLTAHNITILLTYVVGAYTAHLLAYEVTGSRPAAFVAGLVYAFYPHRFAHRGQLKLLSNQWIPLFAFFFIRLPRRRRLGDGVAAGFALGLCGLSGLHQLVLAGMWAGMWLAYSLVAERRLWDRSTVIALLAGALVCTLLLAPFLVPMAAEWIRTQGAGMEPVTAGESSTDLLDYFLPNHHHPLFRLGGVYDFYRRYVHSDGEVATVGWVALILIAWAVTKHRRGGLPWLIPALIFALLALGPALRINGRTLSGIPLPYSLLKSTLFGKFIRHPHRFSIILALPISVLAALGWKALLEQRRLPRQWASGATLCLAGLILFEYAVMPVPTTRPAYSAFYERLKKEDAQFAVADFPIRYSTHDKYYMFLQTLHDRPIVGGHVSRVPGGALEFIGSVPLLTAAQDGLPENGELGDVSRQLKPLAEAQVRYVIIHKDRATEEDVAGWQNWFGFQPAYEDDVLVAYRTEPLHRRDFEFMEDLEDGIGVVAATVSPPKASAGGTVWLEIIWGTKQRPENDWQVSLGLSSGEGQEKEVAELDPFEGWPTSEWDSDEVVRRVVAIEIDPHLSGGSYQIKVGLAGGSGPSVVAGELQVIGIERSFQAPAMERAAGVLFGETLQLLGYDVGQEIDRLVLSLHWRALQRMEVDYKFFVHLYDAESGALVAQKDVIPRDWTYPTTWWEAEEVVSDEIHISLSEVSSGTYHLALGVYDPQTGARLPVHAGESEAYPSGVLVLYEVTVP